MTKSRSNDPFAEREAQKYASPIPSREFILHTLEERGRPATYEQLLQTLNLADEEACEALRRRLKAMERDGQLMRTRRNAYGLVDKMDLIRGRIIGHKEGYGFLTPDEGGGDLFLSAWQMRLVFDGDRVLARVIDTDKRGRKEGAIVEVLERNTTQVVGRFYREGNIAYVEPDHKRLSQNIIIQPGEEGAAQPGQIVIADITSQPTFRNPPLGRVITILGEQRTPRLETDIAIYNHALPHIWPVEVVEEIEPLTTQVSENDKQERLDIRQLRLVTIDGEDARDFDDAVYCQQRPKGGWRLIVAIADVSHYVQPHTALDSEALKRGNSVYFPGQVIPMLPEILSNELCSLKPQVDRLCMVCDMTISKTGQLTHYSFAPGVMHSHARLTYERVASVLGHEVETEDNQHLFELQRLYQALHASREARGAIDFATIETRVIFDNQQNIQQIVPVERNVAHRIIEECMLMANVAAARFVLKAKVPSLFRVHQGPTIEKLADLRSFLAEFGLGLRGGKQPASSDYAELIKAIQGRTDSLLIQTVLLRSLSQAVYTPNNNGHFGLAYPAYAHFTSPIRRYPDLILHRTIRHILLGGTADNSPYPQLLLAEYGENCSMTERRADEATRDVLDRLKCEYMLDKVEQQFQGIITSVTGFGIFVQLQDIYIEGLVHISALSNDYYHFEAIKHRLIGERTGVCYRLGDKVTVRVTRVDVEEKKIDFELVQAKKPAAAKSKKRRRR